MFCKYCGETVRPGQRTCQGCGEALPPATDGNGFWDILSESQTEEEAGSRSEKTSASVRSEKPKTKSRLPWVLLACAVVIASLTLSNIHFVNKTKELQESLSSAAATQTRTESAKKELQKEKEELLKELRDKTEELDRIKKEMNELNGITVEKRAIGIVYEKASESESDESKRDETLFEVEFSGRIDRLRWEKFEDGQFVGIDFDEDGCSEKYGLTVKNDPEHGRSALFANELTEFSAGRYKCLAENEYGGAAESIAELIFIGSKDRDDDERPAFSEDDDDDDPDDDEMSEASEDDRYDD